MKEIILVKYGEIALKGLNKSTFEDMLQKNIKRRWTFSHGTAMKIRNAVYYIQDLFAKNSMNTVLIKPKAY